MINYNAALPPLPFMGKSSINVNNWMGEIKGNLTYLVRSIFSKGEQGFAYDPNDLTTLYQDAAGTIPVTGTGQPVGLMLDKSKGSAAGINLHTTDTPINTTSYPATGTRSGLDIIVSQETSGYAAVSLGMPTVVGKTYLLELIAPDLSGFWVLVSDGLTSDSLNRKTAISSALTSRIKTIITLVFTATAPMSYIHLNRGSTHNLPVTFKGVSCREVLGNHAYQTVSASRPILQQTPILGNELVVNGDFSNGLTSWSYTDANVTNGVLNVVSTGTAWRHAYQNVNVTVGKTYLLSLKVRKSGADNCYVMYGPLSNESALNANIVQANELQYKSYIFTATEATHRVRVQNGSATAGFTVSADDISVREITGYRVDQNYLKFDGVDDKLTTTLPTQLTGCTVIRSVPNVGTQILTNQTIPTPYNDNIDNCGLIVINRALTASETSQITKLFNKAAGV